MMIARRTLLAAVPAVCLSGRSLAGPAFAPGLASAVAAAERITGGRVGLAVLDTATGHRFRHRGAERFGMASTFKFVLCGAILNLVDAGRLHLDTMIAVTAADMVSNSPVTEKFVGKSASIAALCEAAMTYSDNAAANLLLSLVGGPAGLTRFLRAGGDAVTRLDRIEPDLNNVPFGEVRDTTTPDSMLATLRHLLLGDRLSPASRAQLLAWMIDNRTGAKKLRAGLPASWRIGDKTGGWNDSVSNDIAVIWPPGRTAPLLVTGYIGYARADADLLSAQHANLGRAIAAAIHD